MHKCFLMATPLALLIPLVSALAPASATAASPSVQTDHLRSQLVAESTAAVPGTRQTLGLLLEHDPHWHTYWLNPGDSGLPTELELTLPEAADSITLTLDDPHGVGTPAQWQWLPETPDVVANGARPQWQRMGDGWQARWRKSEYFTGLPAEVILPAVDGEGTAWRFADAGLAAVPAPPRPAGAGPTFGLPPALLFASLRGLILNLVPCVFPVLSIKATGALATADDRAELRRNGGWYTLGVIATFVLPQLLTADGVADAIRAM